MVTYRNALLDAKRAATGAQQEKSRTRGTAVGAQNAQTSHPRADLNPHNVVLNLRNVIAMFNDDFYRCCIPPFLIWGVAIDQNVKTALESAIKHKSIEMADRGPLPPEYSSVRTSKAEQLMYFMHH